MDLEILEKLDFFRADTEWKLTFLMLLMAVTMALGLSSAFIFFNFCTEDAEITQEVFTELKKTVEPSLSGQIKALTPSTGVACVVDKTMFTVIVPNKVYRLAVYCDAGPVTYSTLIEVTRFGDAKLYWETNGLQGSENPARR